MFKTFSPYIQSQKKLISLSFLLLLLSSSIRLLEPWPLAFALDLLMGDTGKNAILSYLLPHITEPQSLLWLCSAGIIIIAALRATTGYFSTIGMALAGSRVMSAVRIDLIFHLLHLPLEYHQRSRTGDLTMRLVNDIGMLREVTVTALMPLFSSMVIFIGMITIMGFISWQMTLITLIPIPLMVLIMYLRSKKIHTASRIQRKREGKIAANASEYMSGISTIQAMSLEKTTMKMFSRNESESLKQTVVTRRLSAGMERQIDLLIAVTSAIVLVMGAREVLRGNFSAGELVVFMSYLKNAFRPIREFAKYSARLSKSVAAGERIESLFTLPVTAHQHVEALKTRDAASALSFDNVSFHYPINNPDEPTRNVLKEVSFDLPAGQTIAITGPSGSGKSTLGKLLLRLYEPSGGTILWGEQDICNVSHASVREQISYVPQDSLLFGITIRENIVLGATVPVTDEQVIAAARLANAHDFIQALPEGYETIVSERGHSLSGGQRQRINIARAAIRNTPFLLLDEPGTGLDSQNEHEVMQALLRLMRQRTSLLITHNLDFAAQADHILLLDKGVIVERGNHETLMALQGRYSELWKLQQGV